MGTRHHELEIGEYVYVHKFNQWGEIVELRRDDEIAAVDMQDTREIVYVDYDECYQRVPNMVDRNGHPVCYEHNFSIDYNFYCPAEDENLCESELFRL